MSPVLPATWRWCPDIFTLAIYLVLAVGQGKCLNSKNAARHSLMLLFPEIRVVTKRQSVTANGRDLDDLIILHWLTKYDQGIYLPSNVVMHEEARERVNTPFRRPKKGSWIESPIHSLFSSPFVLKCYEKPPMKFNVWELLENVVSRLPFCLEVSVFIYGIHVMFHTYVPESNEYVKGIAIPSVLDVSSMGIASVPLNVTDQPESLG